MIDSKDISVVIQGKIDEGTILQCLKSIKNYLPDAEIILSSWNDSNIENVEQYCNKIVLNKDPGAISFGPKLNNINRIIVSSRNGVKYATRKYILKIRSDLVLFNDNILKFKNKYPKRQKKYSLFKERIYGYELFSTKSEERDNKFFHSIFHISDWCYFGLKEDIQELFNIHLVKEPNFSEYFKNYEYARMNKSIFNNRTWKMSPEQYVTSENAKKVFKYLKVKHCLDWRKKVVIASNKFIVNNFYVLSIKDWGIKTLKKQYTNKTIDKTICKNGAWVGKNWLLDYQRYCNPIFIIPIRYTWQDDLHLPKYIKKFQKHWERFITPFKIILNSIFGLIGMIYNILQIILNSIFGLIDMIYYILHIILNLIIFMPRFIYKLLQNLLQKEN